MNGAKILLMDCNGETRPRISFLLELAGYELCHVGGIVEAFNRVWFSKETSERYCALVLNNPESEHELSFLVDLCRQKKIDIPVVCALPQVRQVLMRSVAADWGKFCSFTVCHCAEILETLSAVRIDRGGFVSQE